MDLYTLTFKQYKEYLLSICKYKETYTNKPALWDAKKQEHFTSWKNILLERALIGVIPSDVIMSYIRTTSEGDMFRTFRGVYQKGIEDFRISKCVRDLRKDNQEKYSFNELSLSIQSKILKGYGNIENQEGVKDGLNWQWFNIKGEIIGDMMP